MSCSMRLISTAASSSLLELSASCEWTFYFRDANPKKQNKTNSVKLSIRSEIKGTTWKGNGNGRSAVKCRAPLRTNRAHGQACSMSKRRKSGSSSCKTAESVVHVDDRRITRRGSKGLESSLVCSFFEESALLSSLTRRFPLAASTLVLLIFTRFSTKSLQTLWKMVKMTLECVVHEIEFRSR